MRAQLAVETLPIRPTTSPTVVIVEPSRRVAELDCKTNRTFGEYWVTQSD